MELVKDEAVIKKLLAENEEFTKLYNEHFELEEKIAEIDKKHYVSSDEEMERKRLQKIKLAGKDRMMEIIRLFKASSN